jgi:hypothetical protein
MEVKLTADWILTTNTEIDLLDGRYCVICYNDSFQYFLIELAFKTLNIKYEVDESFEDSDENFEKPSYYWYIDNIEDIKSTCPNLYQVFQNVKKKRDDWQNEIKKREALIIDFLGIKKTVRQIQEFLLSKNEYANNISHIEYLLERLEGDGSIVKTKNSKTKNAEYLRVNKK